MGFLLKSGEFISLMVLFNSENKYIVYKVLNEQTVNSFDILKLEDKVIN